MIKCLYKFINVVIFLGITYHACSQNLPTETNKIIENFKTNFEQNKFKSIIDDYENIKSENRFSKFNNEEIVLIRYLKFCSEIYLGNSAHFDDSNFNELLKNINGLKKDTNEQKSYLVCINNTINEVHQAFPELSIKLSSKILNFKDYYKLSTWEDLKYSLLCIQLNSYNRLEKFKEVEKIRLQLETFNKNDPSKKLTLLLEKASYNIKISQFEIAHKFLKAADSLLGNSKHGISASDSIGFSIVWANFFEGRNDIQNAKLYYVIAFNIAEFNNLIEKKYQFIFELARLESDNKLKIKTLENLLSDKNCKDVYLKLAILNFLSIAYGSEGLNKKAIDKLLILYDLENKYFEKVNKITILNLAYYFEKDKQFKESEKYYSIAYSDLIKK